MRCCGCFWDPGNAEKHLLLAMVCMVLLGLVGFYGAEMLLCKSFRVLKHSWKSAMVMAAAILLLGISVGLDLFGVEMRLPKADQVVSVDLRVSSGQWFETTITNEKEIQQMLAFHENLLEQKEDLPGKICPKYYVDHPESWEQFRKDVAEAMGAL